MRWNDENYQARWPTENSHMKTHFSQWPLWLSYCRILRQFLTVLQMPNQKINTTAASARKFYIRNHLCNCKNAIFVFQLSGHFGGHPSHSALGQLTESHEKAADLLKSFFKSEFVMNDPTEMPLFSSRKCNNGALSGIYITKQYELRAQTVGRWEDIRTWWTTSNYF